MKPRLALPGPTALVITRAWYWLDTAIRPPFAALNTLIGACCDKKATSSSNVLLVGVNVGEGEGMVDLVTLLGAAFGWHWHASASAPKQGSSALWNHPVAMPRA